MATDLVIRSQVDGIDSFFVLIFFMAFGLSPKYLSSFIKLILIFKVKYAECLWF